MLQDIAAPVSTERFPQWLSVSETHNRLRQLGRTFGLDRNSRLRLLKNLARLTFDPEDYRTRTGHELQHLAGNDGLEYVVLLEQNRARVRGANIGWYRVPRLLIHKTQIGKAAGPNQ